MKNLGIASAFAFFIALSGLAGLAAASLNLVDGTPAFNTTIADVATTYQLWFTISNETEVNDTNFTTAIFYIPYGIVNASNSCNRYRTLAGVNATYSYCAVYIPNNTNANGSSGAYVTGGAALNASITVRLNMSAFSEASAVTAGRPAHYALSSSQIFMGANMTSIQNTSNSTAVRYGIFADANPRPYFINSSGTFGNNLSISSWNQTDPFYVIQLPIMTFNATSMRPQYSNNSFGDVLYFDNGSMMERPSYMRLYSYTMNFTFLDVDNGSRFTIYNPVNTSNETRGNRCNIDFGDCPEESLMPLLTQTQVSTDPMNNQSFSMTISVPSPSGYDLYVNGTLRAINLSSSNETSYWGLNASFVAGMAQNAQGAFTINVTNADIAKSTTYGLYFTIMNQTDSGGGSLQPTSPIFVINQSISGWDPMSPPAFGQNLTVSYTGWFSNSLKNWTFTNATFLRYFIPTNATPRSPTNDTDFRTCAYTADDTTNCTINMATAMNFTWKNRTMTGWSTSNVVSTDRCMIFGDDRPGEQDGGNVTVCFRVYDLNLLNANFSNWAPNSTNSMAGINFTANLSFPAMDETDAPAGTAGQANSYNITFQASMQTNLDMTDKVPNIAAAGCSGTTITLDGTALTCSTNFTIGSLTINSVSQGSHTISVSYTPPSTSGSISGGSGGSPSATPTPTPSRTPTSSPTPTPAPTPGPSIERKILDSSSGVVGNFGTAGATFDLAYEAGDEGFYGDLSWKLPFEYSEYALGQVKITPAPARVVKGSVIAYWEKLDLNAGQTFKATVTVSKPVDKSVLDSFTIPTLIAKSRPAVQAPSATPAPAPAKRTALQPDYTLIAVVILGILIAGYYFGVMRRKSR